MQKTSKQKLNLGIFVILATVILIAALYFIGNRQHLFESNVLLHTKFYNVNGLQQGNNVRFSGIDVGTVSNITMISDSAIIVEMRIRKETTNFLRNNAIATIGSDGLVGNMIINITPTKGEAPIVQSGDTLQTFSKIITENMLTTLSVTNENAALLTADLLKITTTILEGKGTLGMLINNPKVAEDFQISIAQIKEVTTQASESMDAIQTFSKNLNTDGSLAQVLFSDTISSHKVKKSLSDIEQSTAHLKATSNMLEKTMKTFEDSKGTINYLVKDTLLPNEIKTTIEEIKQSSQKLNDNMDALKHNFFFKGYFKKQDRQARRKEKEQ